MREGGSTGMQHTDRDGANVWREEANHRQLPVEIEWPRYSQRGGGRRRRRDQHRPQTNPGSSLDSSCWQETQARGTRRSIAPLGYSRTSSLRRPIARAATDALPRDRARSRTNAGRRALPARAASAARPPRDCHSFVLPSPTACLPRGGRRGPSPRPSLE